MGEAGSLAAFLVLWGSQTASMVCSSLTVFTSTIWLARTVYPGAAQRPQLAAALTAASLASYLPALLVAPLAGRWADRHDRRRLLLGTNGVGATLSTVLAALLATRALTVPVLVALLTGFGVNAAVHHAAFDSGYLALVPRRHLSRANGLMSASWSLSGLIAPGLATLLMSRPLLGLGDGSAVAVDAASFLVAAACLLGLAFPSPAAHPRRSLWQDVRLGVDFITRRPALVRLLALLAFVNLTLAMLPVVQPLVVKFKLAADWTPRGFRLQSALALLATSLGLGGLAGMTTMAVWGGLARRRVLGVLAPMMVLASGLFLLGVTHRLYHAAAGVFLCGAMTPVIYAHAQTIWQQHTPPALQGRVFAVRRVLSLLLRPAAACLGGWSLGGGGVGLPLAAAAFLLALVCGVQCFDRRLRAVDQGA